jgi:hypothetical protein
LRAARNRIWSTHMLKSATAQTEPSLWRRSIKSHWTSKPHNRRFPSPPRWLVSREVQVRAQTERFPMAATFISAPNADTIKTVDIWVIACSLLAEAVAEVSVAFAYVHRRTQSNRLARIFFRPKPWKWQKTQKVQLKIRIILISLSYYKNSTPCSSFRQVPLSHVLNFPILSFQDFPHILEQRASEIQTYRLSMCNREKHAN